MVLSSPRVSESKTAVEEKSSDIYSWLLATSWQKLIPIYTLIELTGECNLNCRHCYLTAEEKSKKGLSTAQWFELLEQLYHSRALFLSLSGGEIFLRKDLFSIIEKARELNFSTRLFTNGTLITRDVARRVAETSPEAVEVSLYGALPETHDWLTRVPGSFKKTIGAVEALVELGVMVVIKNVWMSFNWTEAERWLSLVRRLGALPRWCVSVVPFNDGDLRPTELRLGDEELTELHRWELSVERDYDGAEGADANPFCGANADRINSRSEERVLGCGAAANHCIIDFNGEVLPCSQIRLSGGNVTKEPFRYIWRDSHFLNQLRAIRELPVPGCAGCPYLEQCVRCPGLAWLEDGGLALRSSWACKVARIYSEVEDE